MRIACGRTMHSMFSRRVISFFGDIPWLPRSPDLNNCFSYGLPEIANILSQALTSRKRKEGIKDKKWLQWMVEIRTRVMVDFMQRLENHIQEDGHHQADDIFH